jgi:hypothetical protein
LLDGLALSAPLNPLLDEEWEQYKKSFNKNYEEHEQFINVKKKKNTNNINKRE